MSYPVSSLYLLAFLAFTAIFLDLPRQVSGHFEMIGNVLCSLLLLPFAVLIALIALPPLPAWIRPPPVLFSVLCFFWTQLGRAVVAAYESRLRNVGLPRLVDDVLHDEGRRSTLEPVYTKLRMRLTKQRELIASLFADLSNTVLEHNRRCMEFHTVFGLRPHPGMLATKKYSDTEWSEPNVLVKMFYATDLKVVFLARKIKEFHAAALANDEQVQHLSAALDKERQALLNLDKKIAAHRSNLRRAEAESLRQLELMQKRSRRFDFENFVPTWRLGCSLASRKATPPPPAPVPAPDFEALFGCPQMALVPASAPGPETMEVQLFVPPSAV
ncbi:hypothetical protein B0J18DRAFT_122215 [Chaetomium sp. MPI-SDFR-AT-0129]|nr:hypothetical protein B0J18DRAFT_122215 [Chaetomium sp. MPI-SDFR-AT-0129]